MSIKGKSGRISPFAALYSVFGLLIISVPFRMYQLLNVVESETGFYKRIDWSVYLMYAVGAVAIILPLVLVAVTKNIPASKSPFRKNKFLASASIIFAIGIVIDVAAAFSQFVINIKSFYEIGKSAFGALNPTQIPLLIESVTGVFAVIYILLFGISYIDGRTTYSHYKFLALTPIFWAMSRLIIRFLTKIAYVNVSDLMLELFGIAFMMIFLLSFARISSELSNEKAMRNAFVTGSISVFFLATANLPRLLMLVTGNGGKLPLTYGFSLCDFGFVLFVTAYMINAVKYSRENDSREFKKNSKKDETSVMTTDEDFLTE